MHKNTNDQYKFLRGLKWAVVFVAIVTLGACSDNDNKEVRNHLGLIGLFSGLRKF